MAKLGLSATVLALFAILPFAASQSSFGVSNSTSSTSVGPCDALCQQPDIVLSNSCPSGTTGICGCTDAYSIATENCARCTLPYSGSDLAQNTQNTQDSFDDFQNLCAQAGRPIQGINLDNIQLAILRPINFTFETPLSMYDSSFPDYINAVCIDPSRITAAECLVGDSSWTRCPNPDVAGILVRVSAYLANLLLGIVLMYSPEESATAVWTQLLTVYSLLVSGLIAIGDSSLSRFHSGMTIFLVMSPLSSSLVVYAVLGFCGRKHRLDNILSGRREHLVPRLLVLAYAIISLAILIFTSTAKESHFSANPCEDDNLYKSAAAVFTNLLFIPYAGVFIVVLLAAAAVDFDDTTLGGLAFAALLPFLLIIASFVCGVVRQRHRLAAEFRAQNSRWKIWVTWDVLAQQYPFMHFCGVFFIPMIYWVLVNELGTVGTPDNLFSLSFGQILALFVILPPLWQVIQMAPRARGWFMNLAVVRYVTGRPQTAPLVRIHSLEDGVSIPEKEASSSWSE
ncbi:hypothetical protein B0H12DRAFT_1097024 [Mycena haematopus]|nr:hypothetical protein B0H12DRAFT_1097024 [Mycena haematopus]